MTRQLPAQEERVETGAVQFGDDWPGIFIRGDNAFAFAMAIEFMDGSPLYMAQVKALAGLLRGCIIMPAQGMPREAPRHEGGSGPSGLASPVLEEDAPND